MSKNINKVTIFLVMLTATTFIWAQPNGGGGGQGNGGPPPSTSGPIDQGAFLLLNALIGYTYYQKKRKS